MMYKTNLRFFSSRRALAKPAARAALFPKTAGQRSRNVTARRLRKNVAYNKLE